MNSEELKPCPLCEGAAQPIAIKAGIFRAWCPKCELETGNYPTQAEANEHWNNRPREALRASGDAYTAALEHAAVYVAEHCVDGESHAQAIRGIARPDFCDGHCTWLDHAPGCERAADHVEDSRRMVPDGWKLVPDYKVGMSVKFGGEEYKIFALGDRSGTFDICHPTDKHRDRWVNMNPELLEPLAAAPSSQPADMSTQAAVAPNDATKIQWLELEIKRLRNELAAAAPSQPAEPDGCGCCHDACKERGSCRHADENPPAEPVAQEDQRPIAWFRHENGVRVYYESKAWDDLTPLYANPTAEQAAQTESDELTDAEIDPAAHKLQEIIAQNGGNPSECAYDHVRDILAMLPGPAFKPLRIDPEVTDRLRELRAHRANFPSRNVD